MRGEKVLTIRDFSPGLVETQGGTNLPVGAAQACQNVLPIGHGGLKRREPAVSFGTFPAAVIELFYSPRLTDGLGVGATNLYRLSTLGSLGAHGLGTNYPPTFVEAPVSGGQGPVWAGGNSAAKYVTAAFAIGSWTASTGSLPVTATNVLAYHGNRMWVGNATSGTGDRLYFSAVLDPRDWGSNSGYVDFDGAILAICPCGPYLLVFTTSGTHVVYDLNTGANRKISTLSAASMQMVAQGRYGTAYFVANGHVYRTDGSSVVQVSPQILNANPASVGYIDGFLILNGTTLYCEDLDSWWTMNFVGLASPGSAYVLGAASSFWLPGAGGQIQAWTPNAFSETPTTGADGDGSTITSYWWGGDSDLGAPELRKRVLHMDVEGTLLASAAAAKDCATSAPSVKSLTFGPSGSTVKSARIHNLGVGRYWAPYLYDASTNGWTARAVSLNFRVRSD